LLFIERPTQETNTEQSGAGKGYFKELLSCDGGYCPKSAGQVVSWRPREEMAL
jgi:hypothetical protein